MFVEGQVLSDAFRLERCLHTGGAAQLWAAWDMRSGKRVALKILDECLPSMPEAISRFSQDARNASRVLHENILRVEELGYAERGIPFLVMELASGRSLRQVLDERKMLSIEGAVALLRSLLRVLGAAHAQGAAHGDLKPSNIMVSEELSEEPVVRITNFGLSHPLRVRRTWGASPFIVGELDYMAPECLMSPQHAPGAQSDVFSCGVMLFEMVTGRLPLPRLPSGSPEAEAAWANRVAYFASGSPVPSSHDVPHVFRRLFRCAVTVSPDQRLPDATAMLTVLEESVREEMMAEREQRRSAVKMARAEGEPAWTVGDEAGPVAVWSGRRQRRNRTLVGLPAIAPPVAPSPPAVLGRSLSSGAQLVVVESPDQAPSVRSTPEAESRLNPRAGDRAVSSGLGQERESAGWAAPVVVEYPTVFVGPSVSRHDPYSAAVNVGGHQSGPRGELSRVVVGRGEGAVGTVSRAEGKTARGEIPRVTCPDVSLFRRQGFGLKNKRIPRPRRGRVRLVTLIFLFLASLVVGAWGAGLISEQELTTLFQSTSTRD